MDLRPSPAPEGQSATDSGNVDSGTSSAARVAPRGYGRPGSLAEYLPSTAEPIDRWFQAANASNVRTTTAIIADLCERPPAYVVDPFAGSGSAAVVARLSGVPFYGIELDPVLACVTIAKALAREAHAQNGFRPAEGRDALVSGCLGLVDEIARQTQGSALPPSFRQDARTPGAPVHERTATVQGDASAAECWSHITPPPGHGVLYTSPPFGPSSPRLQVDAGLRARARDLLDGHGMLHVPSSGDVGSAAYADLVVAVLRQAEKLGPLTAIIEHEPPDDGRDDRAQIADRILADTSAELVAVRETRAYSRRGLLSLFVCEVPG
jgi:hypothetical protein